MPSVQYGTTTIEYKILEKPGLNSHYISVQRDEGVILKGEPVSETKAQQLILKKASWILEKLALVKSIDKDDIVTGSRVQYLGKKYYVQLIVQEEIDAIRVNFTASKFQVYVPSAQYQQCDIRAAFDAFFRQKAVEKITPRVHKWAGIMGVSFQELKFRKLEKRWGSCTPSNNIIINILAVQLPFSLIDYLIVHELVHTRVKNHSKEFWAEVSQYLENWRELDGAMYGMRL